MAEAGVPGYEASGWVGVMAPSGTPQAMVARLNSEFVAILKLPDMRERLSGSGAEAVGSTPDEFSAFIRTELAKWAKVVKEAGIRIE
jgi:tripartite-type tricarboxylate transporter receptor subunit TctC